MANDRRCPFCGHSLMSEAGRTYQTARWLGEIMIATPPEVWREYAADGIGPEQALTMEASYAG